MTIDLFLSIIGFGLSTFMVGHSLGKDSRNRPKK